MSVCSTSTKDFDLHGLALSVKGIPSGQNVASRDRESLHVSQFNELPGMTPAEVRRIYNFPAEWTGKGETILLLNLGSRVDVSDLQDFWRHHGVKREDPVELNLGRAPRKGGALLRQLEPMMGLEWIGALAPDARLIVCNVDATLAADPWAAFLASAIVDVKSLGPTIAVSTWSLPERIYKAQHGQGVFSGLLEQAAAIGMTVIAASGDWGVYDGRPGLTAVDGLGTEVAVAEAPWPHGVFPSVEDYILSVGGTMITSTHPLTELGWSGPLPPSQQLRDAVPFFRLGSSGGFSEDVAIPWWQQAMLCPQGQARAFRRGLMSPSILPSGRGYPDVALMAAGRSITHGSGTDLASTGFDAVVAGDRINWAGGTSIAAPIWSAIIACMNQARRAAGLPRVGFANPLLYSLAATQTSPEDQPFRNISIGNSNVELRVLDASGVPAKYLLEGFAADAGWNPVTGLGVPNVANLIAAAIRPTPSRKLRVRH